MAQNGQKHQLRSSARVAARGPLLPVFCAARCTACGAEAVVSWFYLLHSGEAFGLAGKALISLSGIALNFLILSGLYLWWKRRKPRC